MSDYSTTETDIDLGNDEITEQLALLHNLKNHNDSLTKEFNKLKHDSEIKINDLNIQLEILQKKNKSLNEYNDAIKNSTTENSQFNTSSETEKQFSILENYISDLESEKNLIINSKLDIERQVNNLLIENSNLKLENNKLSISITKLKSLVCETSKDKDILNREQYEGLQQDIVDILLEKDLQIQGWETKYDDFERQAIELITEECNRNFQEVKNLQENNSQLSEKLRETQNELLAKLKEFEDLKKESLENNSRSNVKTRTSNQRKLSNLNNLNINNLNPNNELNGKSNNSRKSSLLTGKASKESSKVITEEEEEYDNQSFNTEEVQVLVENYKELEEKYHDLESEYEQKGKLWEFEMERLRNHCSDSENSLKNRIEDISRMNDILRKEINDYENQQLKSSQYNEQTDNFLFLEIENLKNLNDEIQEQKEKMEQNFLYKISNLNKELKESEEAKNILLLAKEHLNKEISNIQSSCAKKEKEINEKNKIELGYKESQNKELKDRIDSFIKEIELYKKDIIIGKNNYEKLNSAYENFNKNHEKILHNNKNEIERLKEERDRYRNIKENEISNLKKQIIELKESLTEKDLFIANNLNNNKINEIGDNNESTHQTSVTSLSNLLFESEHEKLENLRSELQQKDEKINELNFKNEEFKKKLIEREKLEIELNQSKEEILLQKNNLRSQKELYEKQIHQLQQKNIDINADLLSQKRRTTSIKTENTFNPKQLALYAEMESNIKKLTVENKYLKEQLEISQCGIEKIKSLTETDINYFKQELLHAEKSAIEAKIAVATLAFEKDCEIVKYKNLCKKLKTRLGSVPIGQIPAQQISKKK